jgi:hypothetical protein
MYWALDNNMRAIQCAIPYEAGATLGARWTKRFATRLLPNRDPALHWRNAGVRELVRLIRTVAAHRGAGWQTLPYGRLL